MKALVTALFAVAVVGIHQPPADAQATTLDRCISVIASDVANYFGDTAACSSQCEARIAKGELGAGTTCSFPSSDPKTQTCLLAASEKMIGSRSSARRACTDREIELFFGGSVTCPGENATVDQIIGCLKAQAEFFANDFVRQAYRPKFTVQ